MLTVGHSYGPSRMLVEHSPAFSVPGGSLPELTTLYTERALNPREGVGGGCCGGARVVSLGAAGWLDRNRRENGGLRGGAGGGVGWLFSSAVEQAEALAAEPAGVEIVKQLSQEFAFLRGAAAQVELLALQGQAGGLTDGTLSAAFTTVNSPEWAQAVRMVEGFGGHPFVQREATYTMAMVRTYEAEVRDAERLARKWLVGDAARNAGIARANAALQTYRVRVAALQGFADYWYRASQNGLSIEAAAPAAHTAAIAEAVRTGERVGALAAVQASVGAEVARMKEDQDSLLNRAADNLAKGLPDMEAWLDAMKKEALTSLRMLILGIGVVIAGLVAFKVM